MRPLGAARALRLGFAQAISLWPATLAVFLAGAAEAIASVLLALVVLEAVGSPGAVLGSGLVALFCVLLIASLARVLAAGAALRQGAERMRGLVPSPLLASGLAASARALAYLFFRFLVELGASAWRYLAVGSGLFLYVHSLGDGGGGLLSSFALALALTLALPLGFLARLWTEVAFVRSLHRSRGYLVSLFEAAGALWERPWPAALVLLVTSMLAGVTELSLSALLGGLGSPGVRAPDLRLLLANQGVTSVLAAFTGAAFLLARLQAFLALELDETGELPREPEPAVPPPTAPLIPTAPIIPTAPLLYPGQG